MWRCPRCGAKLVRRNLSHACGDFSVARFLKGKSAEGRRLFHQLERAIAECGPYEVAPAKTRVAFMAQVRFASVNRVGADALDVHFVLPRRVDSARIRRVEAIERVFVHHLTVRAVDEELKRWLCEAYREYGQRAWLRAPLA